MNTQAFRSAYYTIIRVKTWQLVMLLFVGIVLSVAFLRLNNLGMDTRRYAVVQADKKGDKEATRAALVELQRYISSHMNTSLGPNGFYLEHQYNRDKQSALNQATLDSNPNSAVYQQASIDCQNRFRGGVASFRNDYVTCVAERVKALSPSTDPVSLKLPKAENYRYDFASPLWSPDLAGFSVLFCVIITSVIIIRIITNLVLRLVLKHRFKAI